MTSRLYCKTCDFFLECTNPDCTVEEPHGHCYYYPDKRTTGPDGETLLTELPAEVPSGRTACFAHQAQFGGKA